MGFRACASLPTLQPKTPSLVPPGPLTTQSEGRVKAAMVLLSVRIRGMAGPGKRASPPSSVCICVCVREGVSTRVHMAEDAQSLWLTKQSLPKQSLVSTWPQRRNFLGPPWGAGSRAGRMPLYPRARKWQVSPFAFF